MSSIECDEVWKIIDEFGVPVPDRLKLKRKRMVAEKRLDKMTEGKWLGNGDLFLDIENAEKNLLDCNRILQELKITAFLWYGTFLGIYRDGGLIPYDRDVDMGVFRRDKDKLEEFVCRMESIGFKLVRVCKGLFTLQRNIDYIDFQLFDEEETDYVTYESVDWTPPRRTKKFHFDILSVVTFKGQKFSIPSSSAELLKEMYGKDWRTPIEKKYAYQAPTVAVTEPITVISVIKDDTLYEKNVLRTLEVDEYLTTMECHSAPEAINAMIEEARNDLIVIVHDDIIFPPYWAKNLRIPDDPNFGILGVWGNDMNGKPAGHVIEPRGHWITGDLPVEVQSLDELLTIIRKSSGLRFDESLDSFTLYAVDMCLQAMKKGMKNYAIDACVTHTSEGVCDSEFYRTARLIQEKWSGKSKIVDLVTPNVRMCLAAVGGSKYRENTMLGTIEDMQDHMDYLTELATGMDTVVEFGVRYGCSTRSFIKAKPKRLLSYDIAKCDNNKDDLSKMAKEYGVEWIFNQASTHEVEIPFCDLLLIDAEHTYSSVKRELELHKNKAKLIAFHDTMSFPDINRAIQEECGEWVTVTDRQFNNGLLVIKNPDENLITQSLRISSEKC